MSDADLIQQLESIGRDATAELATLEREPDLRAAQARYLKGPVAEVMKGLRGLAPEQRKAVGEVANRVKGAIEAEVASRIEALAERALSADLERKVDVTVAGRGNLRGRVHLLSTVRDEAIRLFGELGMGLAEGPQVETDFHNFEALAIPKDHPARDMQDTFYVSDDVVLRTHTSPVQIRTMVAQPPPIRIIAPGVVYRRDDDPTHSPMFQQIEGLVVDEGIRFSDLKGTLVHFVSRFYGKSLAIRFRPSYFPFVEPGAEMDMQCAFCSGAGSTCRICKGTGWVEIGGCGMVDPDVYAQVDAERARQGKPAAYDPEQWSGFAFGMGLERMAMLRHGVDHIKHFYDNDVRFLEQF